MVNTCEVCKIEFETIKAAKTCSPKCRQVLSRHGSVTPNVTLAEDSVTPVFKFTIAQRLGSKQGDGDWNEAKARIRSEKYWYEIPLAAVPVMQAGYPDMPEYMNGRQYFLWWKNEFKVNDKNEPIIHNPFPLRENVRVELGGESARRWGA